jgi:Protein of unknown function (DUF1638).
MTTTAIVSCRIFEDELTHIMKKENDTRIVLVETSFIDSIEKKFKSEKIEYTKINGEDLKDTLEKYDKEKDIWILQLIEFSMEVRPAEVKNEAYAKVQSLQDAGADGVMVFYGLCGNVFGEIEKDLSQPDCPVRILRDEDGEIADDCICVSLGRRSRYIKILKDTTSGEGTYFLTPMQAAYWREIAYASALTPDPNDDEMLKMVFEYSNYKNVGKVSTGLKYENGFDAIVDDFSKRFDLNVIEYEGTPSMIEKSYEKIKSSFKNRN